MTTISFLKKVIPSYFPFAIHQCAGKLGNILIVAPHPDDDVIGAGGTMALLAESNHCVFSLYVTDGGNFPGVSEPASYEETVLTRQREAIDALRVVKARAGIFLEFKSADLSGRKKEKVRDAIEEVLFFLVPDAVYIPYPLDRHPTHRAVARSAITAIRRIKSHMPKLWGYSIWDGLYGAQNLISIDISRTAHLKKKAIRRHRSQINYKAYDQGMMGRNRYEAVFSETQAQEKCTYVEVFLNMQELVVNKRLSVAGFMKKLLNSHMSTVSC